MGVRGSLREGERGSGQLVCCTLRGVLSKSLVGDRGSPTLAFTPAGALQLETSPGESDGQRRGDSYEEELPMSPRGSNLKFC